MSEPINFEEWVAEMERVELEKGSDEPDVYTVQELSKRIGHERHWICVHLREAMEKGLVRCVKKRLVDISGRVTKVPAYQLVKKEIKKKAK